MHKIVVTGGPCAGKTEIMSYLTQRLEERGYKVLTVPESATIMILNGIHPSEKITMDEFQRYVLATQLANENTFDSAASKFGDKVIIFYDRGVMDGNAYASSPEAFREILNENGLSLSDVYNRYDAVLHLTTTADGAEEFYQWNDPTKTDVGNNAARSETPEEARIKDKKTLNSWIGHPHLRVFDNSTDFEGKIKRVVDEVFALLGEPLPTEIERKFLIKKPTAEQIESLGCISTTNIIQTYLKKNCNVAERRVRQRGDKENGFSFYYTEKTDVAPGVRIENERRISKDEYLQLLTEADTFLHQISKTRHCFVYNKRYFEMDIYPFSDEYAILEIELNDINEAIDFPPLSIVKEVTDDHKYRNFNLAKTMNLDVSNNEHKLQHKKDSEEIIRRVSNENVTVQNSSNWRYETYEDEPEILGSGSRIYNVAYTNNEEEAFKLFKEGGRNTLVRERFEDGKKIRQYWENWSKEWVEY